MFQLVCQVHWGYHKQREKDILYHIIIALHPPVPPLGRGIFNTPLQMVLHDVNAGTGHKESSEAE